jgi:hypothetical protein
MSISRRSIVASAAALPALAVPAVATSADDGVLSRMADQITAEWKRIGKNGLELNRDLEASDWQTFDMLAKQLWATPSRCIGDLAAKARVLDLERGSVSEEQWLLVDDILAMQRSAVG